VKKILLFIFCLSFTGVLLAQEYEEVVYLKNGSVIRGTVIETVPGVSMKMQTKDGNIFVYNMEDVEKVTKELVETKKSKGTYQSQYVGGEKSPALAVLLSAVFPGIGQYYNGDVGKGVIMNVLYVGGFVLAFTAGFEENTYGYSGYYYDYYYTEETIGTWYWVGLGVSMGTAIWSMIDAGISASNYNDRLREEYYGHMFEYGLKKGIVLGLDVSPIPKGVCGGLTLHF